MRIEATAYGCWTHACRCISGRAEMIVVTEIGPRILSLNWRGGPNLLYEDTTGFELNGWKLYGGHRFTVAPEGPESYVTDNAACEVEQTDSELRVSAPTGLNGTRRSLIISGATDGEGFNLQHVLENRSSRPWTGALWGITCVPKCRITAPCTPSTVHYWPGTVSSNWDFAPDHIRSAPSTGRGKVGWHSRVAWLASLQENATLVIHTPDPPGAEECVDGGCNIEVFSCQDYLELETLGRAEKLKPEARACHPQRWRILPPGMNSKDWAQIGMQSGCPP